MSRILVTGSAGFIGGTLVKQLQEAGHNVVEFDVKQGDISAPDTLRGFEKIGISHVFHLAGKTFVPESWKDPLSFYQVNVMGTLNVLELCRKTGAGLTFVSSYLYGEPEYLPIDENHPVKSYNPYSQSKLMADMTCQFYARQYKFPVTIIRPFNVYGPGQSSLFLIPEIIEKVMDPAIRIVEVTDLRPKRDYLYIDDLVQALISTRGKLPGIYNLGSGTSRSVEDIIQLIIKHSGISKEIRSLETRRPNEIFDLYADIRKARLEFGWIPQTSIEAGIEQCIHHYIINHIFSNS